MTESKISYKIVLDKTNLIWVWRNHTRAFNFDIKLKLPYFYEYIVYTLEKFLQEKFSLLSKRLNNLNWISYNFQRRNYLRKYGIRLQCKLKNVIKNRMFIHSLIHSFIQAVKNVHSFDVVYIYIHSIICCIILFFLL